MLLQVSSGTFSVLDNNIKFETEGVILQPKFSLKSMIFIDHFY